MKTALYDKDDILPIGLLIFSTFLMNFGVYLLGAFSSCYFTILAIIHIFLIYRLKPIKYLPVFKIIKYLICFLIFNTIFCFITIFITTKNLNFVLKFILSDFYTVGIKFAFFFAMFSLLQVIEKNNYKTNKKIDTRSYKFVPTIITAISLFCILGFFILFKNIAELLIGLIIILPYTWYVMTLAVKIQSTEIQEQLEQN